MKAANESQAVVVGSREDLGALGELGVELRERDGRGALTEALANGAPHAARHACLQGSFGFANERVRHGWLLIAIQRAERAKASSSETSASSGCAGVVTAVTR